MLGKKGPFLLQKVSACPMFGFRVWRISVSVSGLIIHEEARPNVVCEIANDPLAVVGCAAHDVHVACETRDQVSEKHIGADARRKSKVQSVRLQLDV